MKNYLTVFAVIVLSANSYAQGITGAHTAELRGGRSLFPGGYYALKYERTTSTLLNVFITGHLEASRFKQLWYASNGFDLGAYYYTPVGDNTSHLFECKLGLGLTAGVDSESWAYQNLSFKERLTYGLLGEIAGEWAMSEVFSLTLFSQQQFLLNKKMGSTRFYYGIGIKLNLDN